MTPHPEPNHKQLIAVFIVSLFNQSPSPNMGSRFKQEPPAARRVPGLR